MAVLKIYIFQLLLFRNHLKQIFVLNRISNSNEAEYRPNWILAAAGCPLKYPVLLSHPLERIRSIIWKASKKWALFFGSWPIPHLISIQYMRTTPLLLKIITKYVTVLFHHSVNWSMIRWSPRKMGGYKDGSECQCVRRCKTDLSPNTDNEPFSSQNIVNSFGHWGILEHEISELNI